MKFLVPFFFSQKNCPFWPISDVDLIFWSTTDSLKSERIVYCWIITWIFFLFSQMFTQICCLKISFFLIVLFYDIIIGIISGGPFSVIFKLWLSCWLANLFLQSVLALNIHLNIYSSLLVVMRVINNILIMFKWLYTHF